ncbi:MAG: methyltransferase [bacterium]
MITRESLPQFDITIYQPEIGYRYNEDSLFLVDFVSKIKSDALVADLGAGCGILSLILAKKFPHVKITAVEIEKEPYELLAKNIKENHLEEQITALCSDWNDLRKNHSKFDVIVTNPPFREPHTGRISCYDTKAAAKHELKNGLEALLETVRLTLKEKGAFYTVFLSERLVDLIYLMRQKRIEPKEILPIYPKRDSYSSVFLVKGIKGGGKAVKILPPLFRRFNNTITY